MDLIDRETSVPLYIQMAQDLEDRIQEGIFKPGSKIPSETELMKKYGVSRITARQAMKYLSERDLIVRRRGLGSFVRRTEVQQNVAELFGLYQSLTKIDTDLTMEFLKYEKVSANKDVQENLRIQKDEKILNFIRLYHIKHEVLLAADVFIPWSIASNWSREEASVKDSLRLLEENAGMKIGNMQLWIRATKAKDPMAEYLQVPIDSPVLELRRLAFSNEGRPLQYAIVIFQGESYELTTQITSSRFNEQLKIGKY